MRRFASNKLTIFGSALHYGLSDSSVRLTPSIMSTNGLARTLIESGNKVRHYGIMYPVEKTTRERTIGSFCAMIARKVYLERKDNRRILNIGGSRMASLGSINGVLENDPNTIIIYIGHEIENDDGTTLEYLKGDRNSIYLSASKYLVPKLKDTSLIKLNNRRILWKNNCHYLENDDKPSKALHDALNDINPFRSRQIYLSISSEYINNCSYNAYKLFEICEYLQYMDRVIGIDLVEFSEDKDIRWAQDFAETIFKIKT